MATCYRQATFLIAVAVVAVSHAQPSKLWTRATGLTAASNNRAGLLRADGAGNSIVARVRVSRVANDQNGYVEVVKLGAAGNALWTRPILGDGFGASEPSALVVDSANNVLVIVMSENAFVGRRASLHKINGATGAVMWSNFSSEIFGFGDAPLATDNSNNVFVAGISSGGSDGRMSVTKLDGATGATLWNRVMARTAVGSTDVPSDIMVDPAGNLAVAGYVVDSDGCVPKPKPVLMGKLNGATGVVTWLQTYIPAANWEITGPPPVGVDSQGNVYAGATFQQGFSTVQWNVLKRASANGELSFNRPVTVPGDVLNDLVDLVVDANGVCVGGDSFGAGGGGYRIHAFSPAGAPSWNRQIPNAGAGFSVRPARMRHNIDIEGLFVYAGLTESSTGKAKVVKLARSTGAITWNKLATVTGDQGTVAMDVLSTGDPVLNCDSDSGVGAAQVWNARWHRIAAATGNVAATNTATNSVIPTADYYSCGYVNTNGDVYAGGSSGGRIIVHRLSPAGAVVWQRLIENLNINMKGSLQNGAVAIAKDSASNVLGTGVNRGHATAFKIRASDGALVWTLPNLGTVGRNVAVNAANELFVPGSPPNGLRKISAAGAEVWFGQLDGSLLLDRDSHVAVNSTGVPFVVGKTFTPTGCSTTERLLVARFNPANGATVWLKEIIPPIDGRVDPCGIAIDPTGHVIVAGTMASPHGETDYFAARLNGNNGATFWNRRYDRANAAQIASSMVLDSAGNTGLTGVSIEATGPVVYTLKLLNSTGVPAWNRVTTVPAGYKRADSISRDGAGNFYVTGIVNAATSPQTFGLKLNGASGAQIWQTLEPGGLEAWMTSAVGVVGPSNNLHVLGATSSTGTGLSQMNAIKYNP